MRKKLNRWLEHLIFVLALAGLSLLVYLFLLRYISLHNGILKNDTMQDTIVIRIHNIKKYRGLYEQFQLSNLKKNAVVEGTTVIDQDGVITEKNTIRQRVTFFEDSGKFLPFNMRFDVRAPSSIYYVRGSFRNLDSDKALLEIEFSLPKYFYGTNVFQLLGSPAKSSEANFYMLLKAIKRFMRDNFVSMPKDRDIEIFRLDMCYNQFHKTKKDALDYLAVQRDWMKSYCDGKNMRLIDSYATTWTVITSRYSFKCYHKGTEFYENDYAELVKNMGKHNYDLRKLQGIADTILRYEITYRRSMMQYLTMYYSFQDLEKKAGYMLDNRMYKYIMRVEKRGGFSKAAAAFNAHTKITSPVEYFVGKQKKFCLKSVFDEAYTPLSVFSDSVTFNYSVYRLMYDWFWSFVKKSQPDEAMPVYKLMDKINEYQAKLASRQKNSQTRKKVKSGNLREVAKKNSARILIPALLTQFMDLRALKKYLPEATYMRLQRDFKEIGIPMRNSLEVMSKPPLDYVDNAALLEPMKKNFII